MKLISQAEFARQIGVSRQRVSQMVAEGIIRLVDRKIDPEKSREELKRNLDWGRRQDYELTFPMRTKIKMGEMLKRTLRAKGGGDTSTGNRSKPVQELPTLSDLGIKGKVKWSTQKKVDA